ncbi:MAG: phosphoribosylformylglycinamidine synthase I [Candidatus Melainabacteria bacterium RIFOXYA2_FULL_32_9]|nr:MAG: phosphoribosylformylglycinamidine synthase I [Candidatus Melainabacteria bacterium RIFOXYA2_FULL_32_9]
MKAGIIVFPGTNCDRDTKRACEFFGWKADYIWHDETSLDDYDVIFVPGGFSYGDYVRAGGLAKFSPAVLALKDYVKKKRGFVIGICNGFQILCEAGLLPGALSVNWNTRFICDIVGLQVDNSKFPQTINLPIAHGEGRYVATAVEDLDDFAFLKYADNPNGSMHNIAGLYDKKNRIIGMMPHPERAVFEETGGTDGRYFFKMIEEELICN